MDPLYELAGRLLTALSLGRQSQWPTRDRQPLEPTRGWHARVVGAVAAWLRAFADSHSMRMARPVRMFLDVAIPVPPDQDLEAIRKRVAETVRKCLADEGQGDPETSSLHRARILVTRQLYRDPVLALQVTRALRRYPKYYEEIAHDIFEQRSALHAAEPKTEDTATDDQSTRVRALRLALAESDARVASWNNPALPAVQLAGPGEWLLKDVADRLVIDYQCAAAAADALWLPKPFVLVLGEEVNEIVRSRADRLDPVVPPTASPAAPVPEAEPVPASVISHPVSPYERARESGLVGLAFSGGGIRSATFCLGVTQALADLDLLRRVDYLSTVSGGGYIGAWLLAWIKRLSGGVRELQQRLSPLRGALPMEIEARPIRTLREYSNYLTPNIGLLSADTWTAVVVWMRNTLLNQLVLIALLSAALLVPWLLLVLGADNGTGQWLVDRRFPLVASYLLALVCAAVAVMVGNGLRAFDDGKDARGRPAGRLGASEPALVFGVGAAVLMGAWLTALAVLMVNAGYWRVDPAVLAWPLVSQVDAALSPMAGWFSPPEWDVFRSAAAALFVGLLTIQCLGRYARCVLVTEGRSRRPRWLVFIELSLWSIPPALVGAALLALSHRLAPVLAALVGGADATVYQIVVLPPLVIEIIALTVVLHIGLVGRWFPDERREWWSRLGAYHFRQSIVWFVAGTVALLLPRWMDTEVDWNKSSAALGWLATTAGGVMAGRSASSDSDKASFKNLATDWLARLAPAVFVLGLLIIVGVLLERVVLAWWPAPGTGQILSMLAVLTGLGLLLSWRIDINEFSMHHFYRNRLVRCYLGASHLHTDRHANRFTGFDPNDDVKLADLRTHTGYRGPLAIVNTSLNLTAGSELAWQERKAESFVFTPLTSGYEIVDGRPTGTRRLRRAGHRRTDLFGYEGGPGLGTVAAISGAAASPNMGYHSSPAVAFLLTVFNVRLGWWVGNPRFSAAGPVDSPWRKSSPTVGVLCLLKELFGRTDNRARYINLSDGGHFENLGVYELVRRRCTHIVVVDAEEDTTLAFGGLAGVIRKCRTDFGVEIDLDVQRVKVGGAFHHAVGTITYPEKRDQPGTIVYLKSSMTGDEPTDVREYNRRQEAFPQQTTADQWFDESQFESYRMLGQHIGSRVFTAPVATAHAAVRGGDDFTGALFRALANQQRAEAARAWIP